MILLYCCLIPVALGLLLVLGWALWLALVGASALFLEGVERFAKALFP